MEIRLKSSALIADGYQLSVFRSIEMIDLPRSKSPAENYPMEKINDGILLVDKAKDETSFNVVKKVRDRLKVQKVGHGGTLDPFATGLLVILVGQGTKLSNYIMAGKKSYLATVRLGVETDTLDPTGKVVETSGIPNLSDEYIEENVRSFIGNIEQVPPIYSAVKYKGVRSYRLARKGVSIRLKKRNVSIYSIEIDSIDLPDIMMKITCSRGTYIRSLASDIGKKLGTCAHLLFLKRMTSGSFSVKDALPSKELADRNVLSWLGQKIIPLRNALPDMHEIQIKSHIAKKVTHGYQPKWEDLRNGRTVCFNREKKFKLISGDNLIAIIKIVKKEGVDHGTIKIERVFSEPMVH